jgi:hypothetical protein
MEKKNWAMLVFPLETYKASNRKDLLFRTLEIMVHLKHMGYDTVNEVVNGEWPTPQELEQQGITSTGQYVLAREIQCLSKCNALALTKETVGDDHAQLLMEIAGRYGHQSILQECGNGEWQIEFDERGV